MQPVELQFNKELVFQDPTCREMLFPSFPVNTSTYLFPSPWQKNTSSQIKSIKQTSNHNSDWLSLNHVTSLKAIILSKWRKYSNWKVGLCVMQWLFLNKLPKNLVVKNNHFAHEFCRPVIQTGVVGKPCLLHLVSARASQKQESGLFWSLPYSDVWRFGGPWSWTTQE